MRLQRFVIPLALLSPLALASHAMAADRTVTVDQFAFMPKIVNVEPGDTVTWNFAEATHTTRGNSGQSEAWNSGPESAAVGTSFPHTFTKPGRFQYFCEPHQSFMKGEVVVGTDKYPKSQSSFKQVRRGKKVTFRFTLVEPAKVVAKLKGASRRSVTKRRLAPGQHAIVFNALRSGQYKGTVTFTDDYDKRSVVKSSTVIR